MLESEILKSLENIKNIILGSSWSEEHFYPKFVDVEIDEDLLDCKKLLDEIANPKAITV